MNDVLKNARRIVVKVGSSLVTNEGRGLDEEAIRQVAKWMAYEEFAPIGGGPAGPFDVGPDPTRMTNLTMLVNTLNFAFTDFATSVKFETEYNGTTYVDSEAMVACMHRAITAGEPLLTGEWAARVTRDDLARLFRGNIEMPMLAERVQILNDVGAVLVDKHQGSWSHWVASCAPALYAGGDGLLERLPVEFPRFRDVSSWRGHEVTIAKLAQLGLWSLHLSLARVGVKTLTDPWRATAFADYIVPVALRVMEIAHFTPALTEAIDNEPPVSEVRSLASRPAPVSITGRSGQRSSRRGSASAATIEPAPNAARASARALCGIAHCA